MRASLEGGLTATPVQTHKKIKATTIPSKKLGIGPFGIGTARVNEDAARHCANIGIRKSSPLLTKCIKEFKEAIIQRDARMFENSEDTSDPSLRAEGIRSMVRFGSDALPMLQRMLISDKYQSSMVLRALNKIGTKYGFIGMAGVNSVLVGILGDVSDNVYEDIAKILKEHSGFSFSDLVNALKSNDIKLRRRAAAVIASIELERAREIGRAELGMKTLGPRLIEVLGIDNEAAFRMIANVLKEWPPAIPHLIRAAEKGDDLLCRRAVEVLGRFGAKAKAATPVLLNILNDSKKSEWVKRSAIEALGDIGASSNKVISQLLSVLKSGNDMSKDTALRTLKALHASSDEVIEAYIMTTKTSVSLRSLAVEAIGELGPKAVSVVAELTALVISDEPFAFTPKRALEALGNIGPAAASAVPTIISLLEKMMADDAKGKWSLDIWAAREICTTLAKIGPAAKAAEDVVLRLMENKNIDIAGYAIRTLSAISDLENPVVADAFIKVLEKRSKDTWYDSTATINARDGLIEMGVRASLGAYSDAAVGNLVRSLGNALYNKDSKLREVALNTLAAIGPRAEAAVSDLIMRFDVPSRDNAETRYLIDVLGKIGGRSELVVRFLVYLAMAKKKRDTTRRDTTRFDAIRALENAQVLKDYVREMLYKIAKNEGGTIGGWAMDTMNNLYN